MNKKLAIGITSIGIGVITGAYLVYKGARYSIRLSKKLNLMYHQHDNLLQMYLFISNVSVIMQHKVSSHYLFKEAFKGMKPNNEIIHQLRQAGNIALNSKSQDFPHNLRTKIKPIFKQVSKNGHSHIFALFLEALYNYLRGQYNPQYADFLYHEFNKFFKRSNQRLTNLERNTFMVRTIISKVTA